MRALGIRTQIPVLVQPLLAVVDGSSWVSEAVFHIVQQHPEAELPQVNSSASVRSCKLEPMNSRQHHISNQGI